MQTTQLERPPEEAAEQPLRELNSRVTDGLQVRLLWSETDGRVFVRVEDRRNGDRFCIPVQAGQSPADVFDHPYAYAPAVPTAPAGPTAPATPPA